MTMLPPSRTEFLRSRLYKCACAFNRRNEQKLKNIQALLEKSDEKTKRTAKVGQRKKYTSSWVIADSDERAGKNRTSKEDQAILAANKDECEWVFDEKKGEYSLSIGGVTVMKMPVVTYDRLMPFQRDAVKWVATVGPIGGILADDMGLGKTFMSIASLGARMACKRVRMVLIVAPVSILGGWAREGNRFLPAFSKNVRIVKVHGGTQKDRAKTVRNAWKDSSPDRPYVIISSWGLVCSAKTMGGFLPPSGHHWDYAVLDEAHLIKNHNSNRYKCCKKICHKPGTKRLLLTGTPFQNDISELWSLVHMATAGKVLGKIKEFNKEYGKPIRDARCKNASSYATKQGDKANDSLQEVLKPYLLQRTKLNCLKEVLPAKREMCVWVKPSALQIRMYKEKVQQTGFLTEKMMSEDKAEANKAKMCAFQVLTELRSLCGHPLRLMKGGPDGSIGSALEQTDLKTIIQGSRKVELVVHMLKGFKAEGHKTLVFSQSTQNLDVIQHVLREQGTISVCRIDGSVSEKRREDAVHCFQKGLLDVMLLSTGAGGVGLTLTRACRVIIFDPSWNPSNDAQAVDRAYRIGQQQEVHVYRMFIAGGIEEKMYEKQVHKAGLEKTLFGEGKAEERFFDKNELCRVFAQIPDGKCDLLQRFKREKVGEIPDAHRYDLVGAHSSVIGLSNHSNIYSQKRKGAFTDGANAMAKRLKETHDLQIEDDEMPAAVSESDASDSDKPSE